MWMTSSSARSRSSRRRSSEIFFARVRVSILIHAHRRASRAQNPRRPRSRMNAAFAGDTFFPERAARTLHSVRSATSARTARAFFRHDVEKTVDEKFPSHYLNANKRDNKSAEQNIFRDPLLRTERGDCRWRLRNLQKKPRPRNLLQRSPLLKKQQRNLHRRRRPLLRKRNNGVPVSELKNGRRIHFSSHFFCPSLPRTFP